MNYILSELKFTNFGGGVQVVYANKELAECARDKVYAIRKLGQRRADAYATRIDALRVAPNLESLKNLAGRFHELKGDRAGQWACDLDHPYRLVFRPVLNVNGDVVGLIVEQTVEVVEIVDYHR